MRNWLEKINSLSVGLLFSGGYLAGSLVNNVFDNSKAAEMPAGNSTKTTAAPQQKARAQRLGHALVSGTRLINLQ